MTGTVALGRQEHAYMEPHSAIVIPTGEKDEYVCYFTTQVFVTSLYIPSNMIPMIKIDSKWYYFYLQNRSQGLSRKI